MAQVVNKRKLTAGDLQAIGQLLVEILGGEISSQTRQVILELGDPREIPLRTASPIHTGIHDG